MLLLGGRDLVLLPATYAVRLRHASDHSRSARIQNCNGRLVEPACGFILTRQIPVSLLSERNRAVSISYFEMICY